MLLQFASAWHGAVPTLHSSMSSQIVGSPLAHCQPVSSSQLASQPSPGWVPPSSHSSPLSRVPLPQSGSVVPVVLVVPPVPPVPPLPSVLVVVVVPPPVPPLPSPLMPAPPPLSLPVGSCPVTTGNSPSSVNSSSSAQSP